MTTQDEKVHQRRPRGSGGLRPVGPGKWRVEVYPPDGSPRLSARVTGSEADARRKLTELIAKANSGKPAGDTSQLGGFIDKWLRDEGVKVRNGAKDWKTLDNYRWALSHVPDKLRRVGLRQLKAKHIEAALAGLAEGGLARSSVVRVKTVLGQVLDRALALELVAWNVAKAAALPETPAPEPGRFLTEEELETLWRTAERYPLEHAFLVTGWQLGLRPGELLGLAWPEVDFDSGFLTVAFRLDRGGRKRGGGPPRRKEGAKVGSERKIAMPPETTDALIRLAAEQVEQAERAGSAWGNGEEQAVFTTAIGELVTEDRMYRLLAPILEEAGLEGRYSLTDLGRRSSASYLSAMGMSHQDIADQFGHQGTRMLDRHYRKQLRPNDKHLAIWAARRERLSQ
jgi:integrase